MLKKLNRKNARAPLTFPVKVLQFGKGNFLRAFADLIIDRLNEQHGFNGAITITQVNSPATDDRFVEQEGLYHVVVNGLHKGTLVRDVRLVTSVAPGLLNPFEDYNGYLRAAENPDLKYIISNTTEAGIRTDSLDTSIESPASTFPGKLTALLHHRYTHFRGDPARGLIFLPCELIEHNGQALRDAILWYANHWQLDSGFASWITNDNLFCNSLVDRIVPGFPNDERERLWTETGFEDRLLVAAEPYHLWLVEVETGPKALADELRSTFGKAVTFVDDLAPYRTRKVRILNGAHTAMVPVAYLRGQRTVREAINDELTGPFVRNALEREILPTLDLPHDELARFAADVIERFQNPFIHHELKSIALNSIAKFRVRVLPSIVEYYRRKNALPHHLLQSLAAWILFYRGEWKGETLPVNDTAEVMGFFRDAWASDHPASAADQVLANEELWGTDLTAIPGLSDAVKNHMTRYE